MNAFDQKNVSPYIRTAMYSTLNPPFYISERVIFDHELILCIGGKCRLTIDGMKYICRENNAVLLRPGIPHKFESEDESVFVQPHIHFDIYYNDKSEETPISFKPKSAMTQYELSLITEDVLCGANIPFVFTPRDPTKFAELFFGIIELYTKKTRNFELLYKAKLMMLMDLILTQFTDTPHSEEQSSPIAPTVKSYIDSNFFGNITLDSLSAQFYINKFTLLRSFKSMYGTGVIEYYRNKRAEYAKNALENTNLSISAISEQLDFSDIYSFSRFFKAYIGLSPRDYRKSIRK